MPTAQDSSTLVGLDDNPGGGPRMDFDALVPKFSAAMRRLEAAAGDGLDPVMGELVRIHASSLNGCAFCIDMHTKDARAAGETEQRIFSLPAWRDAPWFTDTERAALVLTEAVTLVHVDKVPREVMDEAARHFEPEQLAQLVALVVTINAWNRISIATRCWEPGSYEVGQHG